MSRCSVELRKNHSGMETTVLSGLLTTAARLRKNHSGMETEFRLGYFLRHNFKLRKNHSGMETVSPSSAPISVWTCCVRTIVVWKLQTPPYIFFRALRCVRTIVVWKLEPFYGFYVEGSVA